MRSLRSSRAVDHRQAAFTGLVGALICFAWSWRPSYWYDEAASLSAARRPTDKVWDLIGHVDVVHGPYYFALHGWTSLFGTSEIAARSLSVIGIAVTCGGVSILGQLLAGREAGLACGLISAVLPGLSWAGAEAREYSWSSAGGVVASLLLVRAMARGRNRDWALYALGMSVATYIFFFCVLLLVAHLVTVLLLRRALLPWFGAAGGVLGVATPILYAGWTQRDQVAWIDLSPLSLIRHVGLRQFFLSTRSGHYFGVAVVAAWLLAALSIWLLVTACRNWPHHAPTRTALALGLPWALIPTLVIVGYSLLVHSIYQERYLTFCAPGLALVLGVGLVQVDRRPAFVTACALLVLLPVPMLVQQKAVASRSGEDYRSLAHFVHAHKVDAVLFVQDRARAVRVAYPRDFHGVTEPNLVRGPVDTDSLWGEVGMVDRIPPDSLRGRRVALFLTVAGFNPRNPNYRWLVEQGCRAHASVERSTLGVVAFQC